MTDATSTPTALQAANITTIRALVANTDADLKAKKFGPKSIQELTEILAEMGLSLGMTTGRPLAGAGKDDLALKLERSLEGISPRTLSLRLRALEEEGIVARETFPEVPPRVEYALTEKGRALVPIVESMRSYGSEWLGAEGSCSEPAEPVVVAA